MIIPRARIFAILALVVLVATTVVASPALRAEAVTQWPVSINATSIDTYTTTANETVVTVCGATSTNETKVSGVTGADTTTIFPATANTYCLDYTGPDGTVYAAQYVPSEGKVYLVALRSGRIKWRADIERDPEC
jgi:hypothetical protein